MSIRRKLTFLLLLMALVPLVVSRVITAYVSSNASYTMAEKMRTVLGQNAENDLQTVTRDFSSLLDSKEKIIKLLARLQAQKVEKRIADAILAKKGYKVIKRPIKATLSAEGSQPFSENKILEDLATEERSDPELLIVDVGGKGSVSQIQNQAYWTQTIPLPDSPGIFVIKNFGFGEELGASLEAAAYRDGRFDSLSGKPFFPFEVSYDQQKCYAIGKGKADWESELDALGSMTSSYWLIRQLADNGILWQYTILDSGVMTFYPSNNQTMPGAVEDFRNSKFYQQIKQEKKIVVSPPMIDRRTGLTVTMVGVPLLYPDGRFAGITGLDLIAGNLLDGLDLPEEWKKNTTVLLVKRLGPYSDNPGEVAILAQKVPDGALPKEIQEDPQQKIDIAKRSIQMPFLKVSNPQLLNKIVKEAESGRSGIERMEFDGKESFCAFGPAHEGQEANEPFLIVIVPVKDVFAQADKEESDMIDAALKDIRFTGAIFAIVAIIAAIVGFRSAKKVTHPISQIAEAGIRLSSGDYYAHVDIKTGDELQRLSEIFNETGPKLLEREKMLRSLTMAMEVQQQLLPQASPRCEGLEVAGGSSYCDETGGDYFDYLTLSAKDGDTPHLGIAIGDVSGHGIGAALIMASVRSVLRSHAERLQDRLDELMCLLNRSLTEETDTGRFVTLCFSIFDPKQRTLRWVSAGHDPALHLHRDPENGQVMIDELPNSGLPLGVIDDADYEAMGPLSIDVGDLIVFGTDGAWETADPSGNAFGKERYCELLKTVYDQPVETIRQSIIEAVTTFRGDGLQLDDITLVVVRVV